MLFMLPFITRYNLSVMLKTSIDEKSETLSEAKGDKLQGNLCYSE